MSDSFGTPSTVAHQAPLSMGFPRQEYWSGLPSPSPENLSDPWIQPGSPASHENSLPLSYLRGPPNIYPFSKHIKTVCQARDAGGRRTWTLRMKTVSGLLFPSTSMNSFPFQACFGVQFHLISLNKILERAERLSFLNPSEVCLHKGYNDTLQR